MRPIFLERQQNPQDDLISHLWGTQIDGKASTIDDLENYGVLLFVVLFYTYPMKFMFSMITGAGRTGGDASMLFLIYGLGFAGIFAVLVAMYLRAWG